MNINRKYILQIIPFLDGLNTYKKYGVDAYSFVCPLCCNYSEPNWSEAKKARKKRARTAAFLPQPKCKYVSYFTCKRDKCIGSVSLGSFLKAYNPSLYKRFCLESEPENALKLQDEVCVGGSVLQKFLDFKPNWNERWEKTRKEELNGT